MQKSPKHKILLVFGIVFSVASPFLFWFMPQWIIPLFCEAKPLSALPCSNEFLVVGAVVLFVSLMAGTGLILWVLRVRREID